MFVFDLPLTTLHCPIIANLTHTPRFYLENFAETNILENVLFYLQIIKRLFLKCSKKEKEKKKKHM